MERFDTIIIGAGPAGVTAAIYAHRSGLSYLLLEKSAIGGKVVTAYEIENYPGISKIGGSELALDFRKQVKDMGINFRREEVISVEKFDDHLFFVTTNKDKYQCESIIIGTGTKENELNLPKEDQFRGRGVSFCATCDGAFYKDKDVVVYGGGDSAITEATFLAPIVHSITMISRHELRGERKNIEKLKAHSNVSYLPNTVITELIGDDHLEGVKVLTEGNKVSTIKTEGIFVYIGSKPELKFLNHLDVLNSKGYIEVDKEFRTKVKGVYAIGDVIEKELRQIVTATNDGAIVIHTLHKDLDK